MPPAEAVTIDGDVIRIDHPGIETRLGVLADAWRMSLAAALNLALSRALAELDSTAFLVSYDYGQGALWWRIAAQSADHIMDVYHQVTVWMTPPSWWTAEQEAQTPRLLIGSTAAGLDDLIRRTIG